jgi:hypothetical protein
MCIVESFLGEMDLVPNSISLCRTEARPIDGAVRLGVGCLRWFRSVRPMAGKVLRTWYVIKTW